MASTAPLKRLRSAAARSRVGELEPSEQHAVKALTAPFGSIRFAETRDNPVKFVVLESTDKDSTKQGEQVLNVVDLLLDTWHVAPPSAIISIPPASKTFNLSDHEYGTQLELAVRRGIAEAVHKTSAWVLSGGNASNPAAKLVGRAMQYGRSEFPSSQFTCIAPAPWELLVEKQRLAGLSNGAVHRYVGRAETSVTTAADFELDANHSHYLFVEGNAHHAAQGFRERLECYLSSHDLSGDGVQTPRILLCISGDESSLDWIASALDPDDPTTGVPVPCLVVADSGGAAQDVFECVPQAGPPHATLPRMRVATPPHATPPHMPRHCTPRRRMARLASTQVTIAAPASCMQVRHGMRGHVGRAREPAQAARARRRHA